MTVRRFVTLIAATVLGLSLCASLILWVVLSAWVPTQGKALLIRSVERQGPIRLSIQNLRYDIFRGIVCEHVRITDKTTGTLWVSLPHLGVRVRWLPLLFSGRAAFLAEGELEQPARTRLTARAAQQRRTQALSLDVRTPDVPLSAMTEPLRHWIPKELTDGSARIVAHADVRPGSPVTLSGQVAMTGLRWESQTLAAVGSLAVAGRAVAPMKSGDRWSVEAALTLDQGRVERLPRVQTVTELSGSARLTDDRLDIDTLEGTLLGSRWTLQGTVAPLTSPALEAQVSSLVDVATFASTLSPEHTWHPAGRAEVRAVCRGPLLPTPFLDCLAHADLRDATLNAPTLPSAVTNIAGSLDYDVLAQRLTMRGLSGQVLGDRLSSDGIVDFAPVIHLDVQARGALPLLLLNAWLPASSPAQHWAGHADVDLRVTGALNRLHPEGRVSLRDAACDLIAWHHAITQLTGTVELTNERIETRQLSLQLDRQPVRLSATILPGQTPHIDATVGLPTGELALRARLTPQAVVLETSGASWEHSRLELNGTLGRTADVSSQIALSGVVELSDLMRVPFLPLPQLEPWRLSGVAAVGAEFNGRLSRPLDAAIRARVQADHLTVRNIPLDQFVCELEQRDRVLRAHIPDARLADGRLTAGLVVEHRPEERAFQLEGDLIALQLARLAEVIPAWRTRQVSGTASAHAACSGTWEHRASWRGEGWVNASGERLGDVPLLDTVFRGLFGVLAERVGLESLRRAQITDAAGQWQLADERFHTEHLRLGGLAGTEPVAIYATGSVGLDQTLDLTIEPELSEGAILEAPSTSTLAHTILQAAGQLERLRQLIGRHRLTGTLTHPEYRFELTTQEVLKQVAPTPVDLLQNVFEALRKPRAE